MGDRLLGGGARSDAYNESPLHQPSTTYYNQSSSSHSAQPISTQQTSFDPLRSMTSTSSSNYNDGNDYGFSAPSPSQSTYTNNQSTNQSTNQANSYSNNYSNNYSSNQSNTYSNNQSNTYSSPQTSYAPPSTNQSINSSGNTSGTTAFYSAAPVTIGQSGAAPVYGYSAPQSFVPQQLTQIGYGSADLVRITRTPTPFRFNKQAIWPTEYPLFTNSSIGYYVSNSEWNRTIASINQAFTWNTTELVLNYSLLTTLVLLFAVYWLILMASSGQSFAFAMIRWSMILLVTVSYAYVLRWTRLRCLNRMMVQVAYESRQYSQADNPSRPGKLPCAWQVDGDQLVVTALNSAQNQPSSGYAAPSGGGWGR